MMKVLTNEELAQLVFDINGGEKTKFNVLYKATYKPIYFILLKKIGNKEEAKEVLQEVYLQAFKSLCDIRDPLAFISWLGKIANTKYVDFVRNKSKFKFDKNFDDFKEEFFVENVSEIPEEALIKKEQSIALKKIIDSLPKLQKDAIYMFYFENMSTVDIAKATNTPENVIRKRLHDGRKSIKVKMVNMYGEKLSFYSLSLFPLIWVILADVSLGEISSPLGGLDFTSENIVKPKEMDFEEYSENISKKSQAKSIKTFKTMPKLLRQIVFTSAVACSIIGAFLFISNI